MKAVVILFVLWPTLVAGQDYNRSDWGRWPSANLRGENGCRYDVRQWHLVSQSVDPATLMIRQEKGKPCLVLTLTYWDRYLCRATTSEGRRVHIDEVVSLREAHDSGGAGWDKRRKRAFRGESSNWVITTPGVNGRKSDTDPGGQNARGRRLGWWPPAEGQACWYALKWIEVKEKWGLNYDLEEARALLYQLDKCLRARDSFRSCEPDLRR